MKSTVLKIAGGLMLIGIVFGGVLVGAVCVCADRERPVRNSDCLIVLGAKVRPTGMMSDTLRYRCESALAAWQEGIAQKIICCGAQGSDEPANEGDVMRAYFIQKGIPEADVIAEVQSVNTRQNLENAAQIMIKQGWKSAAVVTSDYHLERSIWIARDLGLDACGIAAKSPKRMSVWLSNRIRESVSWLLYGARRIV